MQQATQAQINTVIDTLIVTGQMFSAYDVTKKLRHSGLHAFHRDVKRVVHQYDYPSHYTSSIHATLGAVVYHTINDEIDDYDPTAVPEYTNTQPQHSTNATSTPLMSGNQSGVTSFVVNTTMNSMFDARHRYCVRADKVRDAGFTPGCIASVTLYTNKIVIEQNGNGNNFTVDKHSNIRIPGSLFLAAFCHLPDSVNVSVVNGTIEISI